MKQEVYRVAERHARKGTALKVFVVNNSPISARRELFSGGLPDAKSFASCPLIARVVIGVMT